MTAEMYSEYAKALSQCDGCLEVSPGVVSGCTLRKEAKSPVLPEGDSFAPSKFWLLGRNPGGDENDGGRPFIGKGGQCLDRMLIRAGLNRRDFWVTNLCKCYSKDDRPPLPTDVLTCSNWLQLEYTLCRPQLVVLLGNQVKDTFFPGNLSVSTIHGQVKLKATAPQFSGWECAFVFCHHPGYIVRKGLNFEKEQNSDWLIVKKAMEAINA